MVDPSCWQRNYRLYRNSCNGTLTRKFIARAYTKIQIVIIKKSLVLFWIFVSGQPAVFWVICCGITRKWVLSAKCTVEYMWLVTGFSSFLIGLFHYMNHCWLPVLAYRTTGVKDAYRAQHYNIICNVVIIFFIYAFRVLLLLLSLSLLLSLLLLLWLLFEWTIYIIIFHLLLL